MHAGAHIARRGGTLLDVTPPDAPARVGQTNFLVGLLIGGLAAVVGMLPGLIAGARLPLQNLWAAQTLPGGVMPFALLPLCQYYVLALLGILVLPGALVGLVSRASARPFPLFPALGGLAAVQTIAAVQTMVVTAGGLTHDWRARACLGLMGFGLLVFLLASIAVALSFARCLPATATVVAAVAALALGYWIAAFPTLTWETAWWPAALNAPMHSVAHWAPAVITGFALAWCGWRPLRRLGAWAGALAVLWVGGAALQGLHVMASTRAELGQIDYMTRTFGRATAAALTRGWDVALVAAAIGVVGAAIWSARRDRPPPLSADEPALP